MTVFKKFVGHLKTVCKHKYWVCKLCWKFGLYWQGIVHDLSKFNPVEFIPSVKYYSGVRSPIEAEKEDKGYSMAWLHHKSVNKHHFWFWVDYDNGQVQNPVKIPAKYVFEMLADTIAAGIVYNKNAGKEWNQSEPYKYYKAHNRDAKNGVEFMHRDTKALLDTLYVDVMENGVDKVADKIKNGYYLMKYNSGAISLVKEYQNLVEKYYNKGVSL